MDGPGHVGAVLGDPVQGRERLVTQQAVVVGIVTLRVGEKKERPTMNITTILRAVELAHVRLVSRLCSTLLMAECTYATNSTSLILWQAVASSSRNRVGMSAGWSGLVMFGNSGK
ncbi:hypothetical protein E2C01_032588 [Portunus trituberculatus]|uniref:Uncharacterized protein n=1 Tax=Portunus trituberculatus TaxID=210409 RepID=A0A5B7F1C6_PORTR|nr:hypothetical protein [Portunus trituberculatus]